MATEIYLMKFGAHSIAFHVLVDRSMDETRAFAVPKDAGFVYAAAEIWLHTDVSRQLISSEFHTGNLVELLKTLSEAFRNPQTMIGETPVPRGGVCAWMQGYWSRVRSDSSTEEDERLYDSLFPLCVVAENDGCIAIYEREGTATIEVATQGDTPATEPTSWFFDFDRRAKSREADELQARIAKAIQQRLILQ